MPTYVYETVPADRRKIKTYEIRHGINEKPLSRHPETGEEIRRVPASGVGFVTGAAPETSCGAGQCCGGGACGLS